MGRRSSFEQIFAILRALNGNPKILTHVTYATRINSGILQKTFFPILIGRGYIELIPNFMTGEALKKPRQKEEGFVSSD